MNVLQFPLVVGHSQRISTSKDSLGVARGGRSCGGYRYDPFGSCSHGFAKCSSIGTRGNLSIQRVRGLPRKQGNKMRYYFTGFFKKLIFAPFFSFSATSSFFHVGMCVHVGNARQDSPIVLSVALLSPKRCGSISGSFSGGEQSFPIHFPFSYMIM